MTVIVSAPGHAALDLDEAQLAGAGHAALDVVAELLELAVGRLEAEAALDLHDDGAGAGGRWPGCRPAAVGAGSGRPVIAASRPSGTTSSPPSTTGGSGEIWRFELQLLQPLLQPRLQVVGALAGLARVEPGVGLAGLLLELELLGAVVPVGDLLGQPVLDRGLGLVDQLELARPRTSARCSGTTCAMA